MRVGEFYKHNRTNEISRIVSVRRKNRALGVAYLGGGLGLGISMDTFLKDHTKMTAKEVQAAADEVAKESGLSCKCYCCGSAIAVGEPFALVAMGSAETDRVFIMRSDHVSRLDRGDVALVIVQRV